MTACRVRRRTRAGFVLDEGAGAGNGLMVHPSLIEAATSAMEVVAVSGVNAAMLLWQALVERERGKRNVSTAEREVATARTEG